MNLTYTRQGNQFMPTNAPDGFKALCCKQFVEYTGCNPDATLVELELVPGGGDYHAEWDNGLSVDEGKAQPDAEGSLYRGAGTVTPLFREEVLAVIDMGRFGIKIIREEPSDA